jgi:hypothetical protein
MQYEQLLQSPFLQHCQVSFQLGSYRGLSAEPFLHLPFCPDKTILAGFSDSFAPCAVSALAGHHDDEDLICLTRRAVNTAHPAMQSHQSVSFNNTFAKMGMR